MKEYKTILFIIIILCLFSTLLIQDISWEKKYELQMRKTQFIINNKSDSINKLTKVIDSLNCEISTKDVDLGRYEFIMGELEKDACCKRKLETLHLE